jgi:hypothetical protein
MNKLILIGNGFDLAHGLKTSYNDFMLWLINKNYKLYNSSLSSGSYFNCDLMGFAGGFNPGMHFISIEDFHHKKERYNINIQYKNKFLESIMSHVHNYNWVDIESKYYAALVGLYKRLEAQDVDYHPQIAKELEGLNKTFDCLKQELMEYLSAIDKRLDQVNKDINLHLFEESLDSRLSKSKTGDISRILVLNFNYTSTIELYIDKEFETPFTVNYIHGKLGDENNPIIFGYGDEMHKYYEKIEQLDSNDFLLNIKSFGYFKNKNYQDFTNFMDQGQFSVFIMGHSCGLSDRILLNSIFEHKNCRKIKIYYYQKDSTNNDYFEKTQQISRHFKASAKGEMRKKIVPYSESAPLTKPQA